MTFITKKICAGEYEVAQKDDPDNRKVRVVSVYYPGDGRYWIAAAQWMDVNTDPLFTKRDAVASAIDILNHWSIRGEWVGDSL